MSWLVATRLGVSFFLCQLRLVFLFLVQWKGIIIIIIYSA